MEKFLQAVFGSDYGTQAIFANLQPSGTHARFPAARPQAGLLLVDCGVPSPKPAPTLGDDAAAHVRALVIDDVGTKGPSEGAVLLALGEPTTIVETFGRNYQWGYRLSKPVAIDDWGGFFGGIEAMIGHRSSKRHRHRR